MKISLPAVWTGGLYWHLPFCLKKCGYCDFYSVPYQDEAFARYREELGRLRSLLPFLKPASVYWGGGTPTVLSCEALEELGSSLLGGLSRAPGCEVTIEANPGTLSGEKVKLLRSLGGNRLSLGAQSFSSRFLLWLGRPYLAWEVRRAYDLAVAAGWSNINLDLLYGFPGQTREEARSDLEMACALDPAHISWYLLTPEINTPLGRRVREGKVSWLSDELLAEVYQEGREYLEERGYRQYEISNFSRPGCECRHNLATWDNRPYLGIGQGAVSYAGGVRTNVLFACLQGSPLPPWGWAEQLPPRERAAETLMLALRTRTGVSHADFFAQTGFEIKGLFPRALERWRDRGWLQEEGGRIFLSPAAYFVSNQILADFVTPESS